MVAKQLDVLVTPQMLNERWYWRVNDLADMTGLAPSTIRQAIYERRLPALKFRSRGWLITAEDARAWIESESESNVA